MRTLQSSEEATKGKLKERERLAEFGVYGEVDLHAALGKKRVTSRWNLDHRKDGIRARLVAREFKGDETLYDVFAPSSNPSTGRVIDHLSLKKSYHTFTADVTNSYFHVDEDEEYYGRIGESDLCTLATANTIVWPETRWNTLGRFHGRTP